MKYSNLSKIFILLIFFSFYGCNENNKTPDVTVNSKSKAAIPDELNKIAFSTAGILNAYIIIDGDMANKKSMTVNLTDSSASVTIPNLSLAAHTIMIMYEYDINGTSYALASAIKNIDLTSGSDSLNFASNEYDLDSFDNDNDGTNNAEDLDLGNIPALNTDITPPVFTSADTIDVVESKRITGYIAAATDDSSSISYSLVGGLDVDLFSIDSTTGALSFKTPADFDVPVDIDGNNTYVIGILATDGINQVAKSLTVNVTKAEFNASIADAGDDKSASEGDVVILTANDSFFADDATATIYKWSVVSTPVTDVITLSDTTAEMPTFTVGTNVINEQYVFQLIINDGITDSEPDTVVITIGNTPPVAKIIVSDGDKKVGDDVLLNGENSTDANDNDLTYLWRIIEQPPGHKTSTLTSTTSSVTGFTVETSILKSRRYTVELIVNDGTTDSKPVTVNILTVNSPPVADAGINQSFFATGNIVALNGSGSIDDNGDKLTYLWEFVSKPNASKAVIKNSKNKQSIFVPDLFGVYVVRLTVNDGFSSVTDEMTVSVIFIPIGVIDIPIGIL